MLGCVQEETVMFQRMRAPAVMLICVLFAAPAVARSQTVLADSAARLDSLAAHVEQEGNKEAFRRAIELWKRGAVLAERAKVPRLAITMLRNAGRLYLTLGDLDSATAEFERSLRLARGTDDRAGEGGALNALGAVHRMAGRPDSALVYFHSALGAVEEAGDLVLKGRTLSNVGTVHRDLGFADSALVYLHRARAVAREAGNRVGEAMTLGSIASVHSDAGRIDSALAYHGRNLPIMQALNDRAGQATTLYNVVA